MTGTKINLRYVDPKTGRNLNPRETLAIVQNGWLHTWETDNAKQVSKLGTDAECAELLDELERHCGERLEVWKMYQ